jgi:predicted small metal-binding protein
MTSVKKSVVSINSVKCPICKERLTGNNTEELNSRLRMHMAELHQMKKISTSNQEGATMQRASFTAPPSRAEQEVTTFSGRSETDLGPRSMEQTTEVTQFRDPRRKEAPLEGDVTRFSGTNPYEEPRTTSEATQWRYPTAAEPGTVRQVETFSGREPGIESEEQRLKSEEVTEWKYPSTGPEGERGPISGVGHGGGVGHRMMHRKPMTQMLNCPICGNAVYGSDDDDLTDELRFHFRDVHDIRRR